MPKKMLQILILLLVISSLILPTVHAAAPKGLFGSTEKPYEGLKPFPKWTGTLERFFQGKRTIEENCTGKPIKTCQYAAWQEMVEKAKKFPPRKQLDTVNKFLNRFKYIVDPTNWGVEDFWATPQEFLKKFGDCEDYSIAKYMSLRALGWDKKSMRIVVLQDMNLKIMHAVLMVNFKNKRLILDNQISLVVEDTRIRHYKPIFSINEFGWWRHKAKWVKQTNTVKKLVKKKVVKRKVIKKQ